jgi:hypothetical protein
MVFGVRDKAAVNEPFLSMQCAFNEALAVTEVLIVVGYSWGDDYINSRIINVARAANGPLIVDVSQDALVAARDARRVADIFVGGGSRAALNGERVTVAIRGRDDPLILESENGLRGSLKVGAELLSGESGAIDNVFNESYFPRPLFCGRRRSN